MIPRALCVVVVLAAVLTAAPAGAATSAGRDVQTVYLGHAPILIQGDADLTPANGVTGGSGTPSDPYVISGWGIDSSTGHLIDVRNTRAPLVIRDVYVSGGNAGIQLANVTHVELQRISAIGDADAVHVERSAHLAVRNSNLSDCARVGPMPYAMAGLYLEASDDVVVSGNRFGSNCMGVDLESTTNLTLEGNTFTGNGILIEGATPEHFLSHTLAADNVVNGKPLLVYRDASDLFLDRVDAGEILLLNVTDARLSNLTIARTDVAVEAAYADGLEVTGSRFVENAICGVYVVASERVRVSSSSFRLGGGGIALESIRDAVLENNTILGAAIGVSVRSGDNVTVRGNEMDGSGYSGFDFIAVEHSEMTANRLANVAYAVRLSGCSNLTVSGNVVGFQGGYGLSLVASRDNQLMSNYLTYGVDASLSGPATLNNTFYQNALYASHASVSLSAAGPNTWDAGYPAGGNYWSWYAGADGCRGPAQDDCSGPDGIGDVPVDLGPGNADPYPLMAPVNTPPSASFAVSPSTGTVNDLFVADASATADAQDVPASLEVRWDWEGDGLWDTPWSAAKTAAHRYGMPEIYAARMEVRDSAGYLNATSRTVVVLSPITLGLSATPAWGLAPLTVAFAASVGGAVGPVAYLWQFGDGAMSVLASPTHTYTAPGCYSAVLGVRDARGFEQGAYIGIVVGMAPLEATAAANVSRGVAPLVVAFTSSVTGGAAPYSLGWVFGDGGTSGDANPVHTYAAAGRYVAQLVVRDGQGTLRTANLTVEILPALDARPWADVPEASSPLDVRFEGNASGGTGPYTYAWQFGDGAGSTEASPSHTYAATGTYTVTLTVIDADGRSGTRTFEVAVSAPPAPAPADLAWVLPVAAVSVVGAACAVLWWRRSRR